MEMLRWRFIGGREDGCAHSKAFKSKPRALDNAAKAFTFLHTNRRTPMRCMDTEGDEAWSGRLHMCLHCVFVGKKPRLATHAERTGHYLFVDVSSKHVFCTKCDDYIYDGEFERISRRSRAQAAFPRSAVINSPWLPTSVKDHAAFARHMEQQPIVSSSFTPGLGLRGLCNLGNSCFTSCVIQALVHNPLLRNYFLMGRHKKTSRCRLRGVWPEPQRSEYKEGDKIEARWASSLRWYSGQIRKVNENGSYEVQYDDGDTEHEVHVSLIRPAVDKSAADAESSKGDKCLGCALGAIFFDMYSGETKQFSAHKLLYAVWQHSKHLAGYSQQDAHEFFLALLDGLHVHLGGAPSGPPGVSASTIIQQIFTGALQSDVTCTCGAVSTTIDPFWDISLDIRPIAHMPTPQKVSSGFEFGDELSPTSGASRVVLKPSAAEDAAGSEPCTLEDCLDRYVRTEQLSSSIFCSRCNSRQQATKRMSISELPMVVCFHLKRFEHDLQALKIDSVVRFPETIDMRPYLAESLRADPSLPKGDDDSYEYSLFAVINHHGTMQQGHYTSYVRVTQPGEEWFLCDDEAIHVASSAEVLTSEGYMLFYIKRQLEIE